MSTLDVEFQFEKLPDQGADEIYELWLLDQTRSASELPSRIESIRVSPNARIGPLELSPREFIQQFRNLDGLTERDALQFGEWLHELLFAPGSPQREVWDRIVQRAGRENRPVRLQVSFGNSDTGILGRMPYELLAAGGGFLFRRPGWSIVRAYRDLDGEVFELAAGHRIGLLWANPVNGSMALPANLFEKHEDDLRRHAQLLKLEVRPPRKQASRQALMEMAGEHADPAPALDVLSIVAHGSPGRLWLHDQNHPQYPLDPGQPVAAAEFANELRRAQVKVGFLWSCHAAESDEDFNSVVRALLDQGALLAVVGSQAALRAELATTPQFARELLSALATTAQGHLDRAVSDARRVLPASDLQWAAPLYYARPLRGRSVNFILPAPDESAATVPWSLRSAPERSPHFKGRQSDLADALRELGTGRCLTLTGLPGAGKSELARELLERIQNQAQETAVPVDEAVWVRLTAIRDAIAARGRIAAVLELRDADTDEQLAGLLKSRRMLLVLDNAEDVLNADRAGFQRLLETLLIAAPSLRLLLTSRVSPGDLEGVISRERRVDLLPAPHDLEAFVSAAGERVSPDEQDAPELKTLVKLLEGHPRSLMLVAGQVGRGRSLTQLREALERDTIDALTAYDLIGVPAGQMEKQGDDDQLRARRLASSLNLSFAAVREESVRAAEAFCWLGLFPTGIPSVLLSAVFGEHSDELLVLWLRHSLVQVTGPERRVLLPAPLRWYARRQLQQVDAETSANWLSRTCQTWADWLQGQYDQNLRTVRSRVAMRVAADESANLTALMEWALSRNPDASDFTILGLSFAHWAAIENYADRAAAAIARLHPVCQQIEEKSQVAGAFTLKALGDLQFRAGRLRESEDSYQAALPIFQRIRFRLGEANTLHGLGDLYARVDKFQEAEVSYRTALSIHRQIKDQLGEANTLKALGDLQFRAGRLHEAEGCYRAALPIYQQIKARLGEANTLKALGNLAVAQDQPQAGFNQLLATLPLFETIEDYLGLAGTLGYLARAGLVAGETGRAILLGTQAWQRLQQRGDHYGQALALEVLGQALAVREDPVKLAAFYLAWVEWHAIDDPVAGPLAQLLSTVLKDFNGRTIDPKFAEFCREALFEAAARCQKELEDAGIDPLSPLPDIE